MELLVCSQRKKELVWTRKLLFSFSLLWFEIYFDFLDPFFAFFSTTFTFSANAFPALNLTTFLAGTFIFSFVLGFTQVLASRTEVSNFPNPMKATPSPETKVSSTVFKKAATNFSASVFVFNSAFFANSAIKSFLFIFSLLNLFLLSLQ